MNKFIILILVINIIYVHVFLKECKKIQYFDFSEKKTKIWLWVKIVVFFYSSANKALI